MRPSLNSPLKIQDYVVLALPPIFFPLSFIAFKGFFIVSMALSTTIMGFSALAIMAVRGVLRGILMRRGFSETFLLFLASSIALYIAFLLGGILSDRIGMWGYVADIYSSIRGFTGSGWLLQLALGVIGFMEEIYWRGYLQGYVLEGLYGRGLKPLILTSIYYTAVHIPTGNPPLVVAALIVGLVLGYIALRAGIICSIASHIAWLEAVVIYAPVDMVLSRF
ncbi:MAG: CPBP family intramembrane glutamic endopeptidase [Sulfolobales archaeon]